MTAVEPCPEIAPGPGRVVLGTFVSTSTSVVELTLDGEDAPLRPTAAHRFFSEDRQAWVRAGDLTVGESLRTRSGPRKVLAVRPLPGGHRVYNLEVHTRHCYYVGNVGLLGHNACTGGESADARTGRQNHEALKQRVRAKPGWRSEPRLIDPKTGKTVVPDAVSPSGHPVELKPNTSSGRQRGASQMRKYERATGKRGRVVYY